MDEMTESQLDIIALVETAKRLNEIYCRLATTRKVSPKDYSAMKPHLDTIINCDLGLKAYVDKFYSKYVYATVEDAYASGKGVVIHLPKCGYYLATPFCELGELIQNLVMNTKPATTEIRHVVHANANQKFVVICDAKGESVLKSELMKFFGLSDPNDIHSFTLGKVVLQVNKLDTHTSNMEKYSQLLVNNMTHDVDAGVIHVAKKNGDYVYYAVDCESICDADEHEMPKCLEKVLMLGADVLNFTINNNTNSIVNSLNGSNYCNLNNVINASPEDKMAYLDEFICRNNPIDKKLSVYEKLYRTSLAGNTGVPRATFNKAVEDHGFKRKTIHTVGYWEKC